MVNPNPNSPNRENPDKKNSHNTDPANAEFGDEYRLKELDDQSEAPKSFGKPKPSPKSISLRSSGEYDQLSWYKGRDIDLESLLRRASEKKNAEPQLRRALEEVISRIKKVREDSIHSGTAALATVFDIARSNDPSERHLAVALETVLKPLGTRFRFVTNEFRPMARMLYVDTPKPAQMSEFQQKLAARRKKS